MPKQVLFIQGAGAGAHEADARLAASLRRELGPGYEVRYPSMPNEDDPDPAAWTERIVAELAAMGDGAIVVGHSAGGSNLLMTLVQKSLPHRIAGVFLISAPYFGDGGWRVEGFEFPEDIAGRLPRGSPVFLYHGRDDETVPVAHLDIFAKALPQAQVRRLEGRGHQLDDDLSVVAADIRQL